MPQRRRLPAAGVRAEWNTRTTSAAQSECPDQQVRRPQAGGSSRSTMAAATNPIWSRAMPQHEPPDQRRESAPCGSAARSEPDSEREQQRQKDEGEYPVGPGQHCQRSGRRRMRAITEREPEAEQAGVEVGDLGPEQDHHEPECRGAQHQAVCADAREGATAAPRSPWPGAPSR